MALIERDAELAALVARAGRARAGEGGLVLVAGEPGAGKTSFVEEFIAVFVADLPDQPRILWGSCDPLTTPRPLGPIHDVAPRLATATDEVLTNAEHAYEIFDAVFCDLAAESTVLVIDDLHWADQGTVDLLRFILRRVRRTPSLIVVTAREEEIGISDPIRLLLGDIARSQCASSITLQPLSLAGVTSLVGERPIDPAWLHRLTGGNPFFVSEMLDHPVDDLPTTVRNAVLARTADLDDASWDVMNLLACAPGALPDQLLTDLGVSLPVLRSLNRAHLTRRGARGVAFRHDLCRLAIADVLPPGAEPALHRRIIAAYDAVGAADPAVITHHALGAGDRGRIRTAASEAGRAAARSGAHRQAADFYRIALEHGGAMPADAQAELLELLAAECYLIDRLDDAIEACRRAMGLRHQAADISADHHAMAVYQWYNANRSSADHHVAQAIAVLDRARDLPDTPQQLAALGHGFAMQAYLAMQACDLPRARSLLARAREIAVTAGESALNVRVDIIDGICSVLEGESSGRTEILAIMASAPLHLDEIYSSGYSNLTYLDVEQRRLAEATELLDVAIQVTVDRDLPVCRVWQIGSRGRLQLLKGGWDDAHSDATAVLAEPCAPLARTWPHLVRGLVAVRRGGGGGDDLAQAWQLARRYDEPLRTMPAAAALVERLWLTGEPDERVDEYVALLDDARRGGLEWARGELAMWLRRAGLECNADFDAGEVAEPYGAYLAGDPATAAELFERLSVPYEAALALTETGEAASVQRGLDMLDRLGATAVAGKVRLELRAAGATVVPARRRTSTLANPAGLTARQIEVLRLMGDGLTNSELATRLYLSAKTVDHHVSAILAKLGVPNRREAVRRARASGLLDDGASEHNGAYANPNDRRA